MDEFDEFIEGEGGLKNPTLPAQAHRPPKPQRPPKSGPRKPGTLPEDGPCVPVAPPGGPHRPTKP